VRLRRILKLVPKRGIYLLLFCCTGLAVAIVYPYISEYAVTQRGSTSPGGEMLLWLLPFMVCVAVNTARQWKTSDKQGGQKE